MTLYLKYRPKNLEELDLPEVSQSLKKIVKSGKIPHAFLFAGPKGTGKTSAARILAKIINCEKLGSDGVPCDKCEQCISISKGSNLDVIEMDAASHRGIDDVRTLRDAVKLAPAKAKKKIYIIDEAHMLTTEASNALLKTLEEPPDHVIFILATTNPEKLIETIRSRVTNILFRNATPTEIVRSLKRVAKGEKLKVEDDALSVIAQAAGGAFRDAIKILEQVIAEEKELSKEVLEEFLFRNKSFDTDRFIKLLIQKDTQNLIVEIGKLGPSGVATDIFLNSLIGKLRRSLLAKVGVGTEDVPELGKGDTVYLIELFSEALKNVSDYPIEELPLELAVIKWCEGAIQGPREIHPENSPSVKEDSAPLRSAEPPRAPPPPADTAPMAVALGEGIGVDDSIWKMILSLVKPVNASVEALLRAARPIGYDGKILTLGVFYKFHKERLEDVQHRRVLESIVGEVLKSPTRVVCTLVEPPPKKIVEEAKVEPVLTEGKDQDIIKVAEEIFGN
ncbi:MAG TPA: DNA polymerase III subunit gamma/tau [Patescibacteria group bacterium]|nr:DNA polymerase III subunit gamma/tau [Patescibacteria group bacterium]